MESRRVGACRAAVAPAAPACAAGSQPLGCRIARTGTAARAPPSDCRASPVALAHLGDAVDARSNRGHALAIGPTLACCSRALHTSVRIWPLRSDGCRRTWTSSCRTRTCPDAQARLTQAGWQAVELDDHDRRYYYEWSHEVPPMTSPDPPDRTRSASQHPSADRAHTCGCRICCSSDCARRSGRRWQVLDPIDQVLHSAAHLFLDPDARDRFATSSTWTICFGTSATQAGFWTELPAGARSLGLAGTSRAGLPLLRELVRHTGSDRRARVHRSHWSRARAPGMAAAAAELRH